MAFMERYGMLIGPTHPLRQAIEVLRETAARKTYGDKRQMQTVILALLLVRDFHQIGQALTEEPVAAIQAELVQATSSGGLSRELEDIRTQFWFGAMLAHGGLRPGVPPVPNPSQPQRRPDFVVKADGLDISVEVKRSKSMDSAFRAIKSAASQIRAYGDRPGFIAVDLGRALDADIYGSAFADSGANPVELFGRRFRVEAPRLSARIHGLSPTGAFKRILGIVLFARVAGFLRSDSAGPLGAVFVEAPLLPKACEGLLRDTGSRVRTLMLSGLASMSGSPVVEG